MKKINYRTIGFLTGLGAWLAIFLAVNILEVFKVSLPILWQILAYPFALLTKLCWQIFNVYQLPDNMYIVYVMFLGAALTWGVVGLIISFVFEKIRK